MNNLKKQSFILLASLLLIQFKASSFCGFYVAKADSKLFNKSSQVIIARYNSETVVTMQSDFSGNVSDFAMVVPVPVVLQRDAIKTVNPALFATLDAYSAPRMAEYYDRNPCHEYLEYNKKFQVRSLPQSIAEEAEFDDAAQYNVQIEAQYEVDEYNILILSAKESEGLKKWLLDKGYQIPEKAEEVLDPYIKNNLKFFVVKVNQEKIKKGNSINLSPLQIRFKSSKFMLPIRLGMANANGDQDMIVYALSSQGRVETSNYRTMEIPTNFDVPLTVQHQFGSFYHDLFNKLYKRERGKPVFLEYAWDVSANIGVKCDPCVGPPPIPNELLEAGAFWLNGQYGTGNKCFFTRMHVRYNRKNFPQDLQFIETPNQVNFQGRYVIRHPAPAPFCEEAHAYLENIRHRREKEVMNLTYYTGWDSKPYLSYITEFDQYLPAERRSQKGTALPVIPTKTNDDNDGFNEGTVVTDPASDLIVPKWLFYMVLTSILLLLIIIPLRKTVPVKKKML